MSESQRILHDFAEVLFYPADREYVEGDISRDSFKRILEKLAYSITHRSLSRLLITKRIKELTFNGSESTERAFPFYSHTGETVVFLKGCETEGPRVWLTWSSYSYWTKETRDLSTDEVVDLLCSSGSNLLRVSFTLIRHVRSGVQAVINDYDERLAGLNGFASRLDGIEDKAVQLAGNRKIRELLENRQSSVADIT